MAPFTVVAEEHYMARKTAPLPPDIIPFILANLEGFDIVLEDSERIVITPKDGAEVAPASRSLLTHALTQREHDGDGEGRGLHRPTPLVARPKFIYRAADKRYTPEQAKRFGLSPQRLKVYELIYTAGTKGIGYKDVRAKSNLPHGSVQQVLHWLRAQKLITGEPETT